MARILPMFWLEHGCGVQPTIMSPFHILEQLAQLLVYIKMTSEVFVSCFPNLKHIYIYWKHVLFQVTCFVFSSVFFSGDPSISS